MILFGIGTTANSLNNTEGMNTFQEIKIIRPLQIYLFLYIYKNIGATYGYLVKMIMFCSAPHIQTTIPCVSVAHQSLATTTAASWRVSMNLKAPSTPPGDKTTLFVCGALHPATKAFYMLCVPSFSLFCLSPVRPLSLYYT